MSVWKRLVSKLTSIVPEVTGRQEDSLVEVTETAGKLSCDFNLFLRAVRNAEESRKSLQSQFEQIMKLRNVIERQDDPESKRILMIRMGGLITTFERENAVLFKELEELSRQGDLLHARCNAAVIRPRSRAFNVRLLGGAVAVFLGIAAFGLLLTTGIFAFAGAAIGAGVVGCWTVYHTKQMDIVTENFESIRTSMESNMKQVSKLRDNIRRMREQVNDYQELSPSSQEVRSLIEH